MAATVLDGHGRGGQAGAAELPGRDPGSAPWPQAAGVAAGRGQPPEDEAAAGGEPDEVLVADPRGALTPAQHVDQKLLVLLRAGHPGLYLQAAGLPQEVRRLPAADTAHRSVRAGARA